jgi:uncharacterized protein YceK
MPKARETVCHGLVLTLAIWMCGCGTLTCLSGDDACAEQAKVPVYCGTRCDATAAFRLAAVDDEEFKILRFVAILPVLDLPTSLIADTVCLLYTVPKAVADAIDD